MNSRENALTRWSNDAVSDPVSEVFYIRDDATGELISPTASPVRDPDGTYVACHGRGYSRFTHTNQNLAVELLQFVPRTRKVKVSRLTIRNLGAKARRLSVCAYVEWTLGVSRATSAQYVLTETCLETGALLARNPWNTSFPARTAFFDLAGEQTQSTCDRREFLGLDGALDAPSALRSEMPLSGRSGAGLDPCAALLTEFELAPGSERQFLCFLGQAEDPGSVITDIKAARNLHVEQVFDEIKGSWEKMLGRIQVTTPDRAFDVLLNRWLPYQVLSCRVWARAAFYQAGGAFGFRDQLQDCMALTTLAPAITRAHLLRAAGRQFEEGDVQHWWMPESGRGVRTRISDDRVWLAYCTAHYVTATADQAVLDEPIS
jgi:cyclic beta-1,2-glucan synthetase